jgi:Lrp/AsnC family transcriptional regulator, regulator for asnA, asnC and gidA
MDPRLAPVKLTKADIEIIQCLQHDPRLPVAQIAKLLRMPASSVRNRLQQLLQNGVVQFDTMTNPWRFGYNVWMQVEIQAEISKIESVAEALARLPEIYLVLIMTGRYDILIGTTFRTNEAFLEFTTNKLSKIPGITRVESAGVLRLVKRATSVRLDEFARELGAGNGPKQLAPARKRARRKLA